MAIEDEIINITDIDVGTEILNNDRLIIETNNGTKLVAFKDLVIGEDNITFKDKLVQGAGAAGATGASATGSSSTAFTTVTGYKILTSATTPGHLTKYADISGTVELGTFNYNAITQYASLSDSYLTQDDLSDIRTNIAAIGNAAPALAEVLTLSATNFKVVGGVKTSIGGDQSGNKNLFYNQIQVDPTFTNPDVAFTQGSSLVPCKITYPSASDGSFSPCFIMFSGSAHSQLNVQNPQFHIRVYKNGEEIHVTTPTWNDGTSSGQSPFSFIEYITYDDVITISTDSDRGAPGGFFQGIKLAT